MPANHVLVLSRLTKSYRAGVLGCAATAEVLRGLSLRLRPGELTVVEGPRGAGKTTLLLCAAGMLRPDEGDVKWPLLPARFGRPPGGIAYAADRAPMYGFLSVRESVAYASTVRELHDPGAGRDGDDLLDIASLHTCAESRVALLGAAERSRLLVALALVSAPQLLLVDDLSGGQDAVGRAAFVKFLARVAASGVAVLWSARSIGAVSDATAAYRLEAGRLKRTGAFAAAPRARKSIELDVPAAARAAAALAPLVHAVEHRGQFVRVPLDGASAEEVLALCRDLAIPVRASRVVRDR